MELYCNGTYARYPAFSGRGGFLSLLINAASALLSHLRLSADSSIAVTSQKKAPDDEDLLKRAQNGGADEFEKLIKPYEKLIYNIAYTKVGNQADASDVTQEIFIKVWRSLPGFRGDSSFSTWLCRIAVNCSLDFLRKNRKATVISLTSDNDDDDERHENDITDNSAGVDPELSAERSETIDDVRRAIANLPEEARTIIVLRDIEGKSYTDIADILSLELGTVKSRINRARLQLKQYLSQKGYF